MKQYRDCTDMYMAYSVCPTAYFPMWPNLGQPNDGITHSTVNAVKMYNINTFMGVVGKLP